MKIIPSCENSIYNGEFAVRIEFESREEYDKFLSDNVYDLIPNNQQSILWQKSWAESLMDVEFEYQRNVNNSRNNLLIELENIRNIKPPITQEETTKEYFDKMIGVDIDKYLIRNKENIKECNFICNPIENFEVE